MGRSKEADKWVKKICETCGKEFETRQYYVLRGQMKYCSVKCVTMQGKNNPRWKGGKIIKHGRVVRYMPEHPNATKQGYVYEYRLLMEKKIGRYLNSEEVVHHINGDKNDNRVDNLMLFKNHAEHKRYHHKEKKYESIGSST